MKSHIKPITFKHWELYDSKGYKKDNITFTENNTRVVDLNTNLYHGSEVIVDTICPAGQVITIPGMNDVIIDDTITKTQDIKTTDIYSFQKYHDHDYKYIEDIKKVFVPTLQVIFFDSEGNEIDNNMIIDIKTRTPDEKIEKILSCPYRDISMTNFDDKNKNRFKTFLELFRFSSIVTLNGEQHLQICTDTDNKSNINKSNIDRSKTKISIGLELWG